MSREHWGNLKKPSKNQSVSSAAKLVGVLPVLFYCEILKTLEQIIKNNINFPLVL